MSNRPARAREAARLCSQAARSSCAVVRGQPNVSDKRVGASRQALTLHQSFISAWYACCSTSRKRVTLRQNFSP